MAIKTSSFSQNRFHHKILENEKRIIFQIVITLASIVEHSGHTSAHVCTL